MKLSEDKLYIFRVKGMDYNEETNKVEYSLSKEFISIDKGMAIYWHGFTNHYVLIGNLRAMFSPEGRNEILQTAHDLGDHFIFGHNKFMAIWTGDWEPLERIGMVAITFQTSKLEAAINDVFMNMSENNGKLKDRT